MEEYSGKFRACEDFQLSSWLKSCFVFSYCCVFLQSHKVSVSNKNSCFLICVMGQGNKTTTTNCDAFAEEMSI